MSYAQKNYKRMLAVEELGFLKENGSDFGLLRVPQIKHGESSMSIMTTSSSYEKIDEEADKKGGKEVERC